MMSENRRVRVLLLVLLSMLSQLEAAQAEDEPGPALGARVSRAIDAGVKWMRGIQQNDGTFPLQKPEADDPRRIRGRDPSDMWAGGPWNKGAHALCVYTLAACDVQLDDSVLAKAFALGKGAYYTFESIRHAGDAIVVDMHVRFAYGDIDITGFPPGTVFYACGAPLGRIEALTIPRGAGSVDADVLATVDVRWTLVPAAATADCPERLTVALVEALPESATSQEITWEF